MFCGICQKAFKAYKMYNIHMQSKPHNDMFKVFENNPREFREKISEKFIEHFTLFISNIYEYTKIDIAYQKYISGNKYRIKGSSFKSINDCISILIEYVSVKNINGEYYIKRQDIDIIPKKINVDELYIGF